MRLSTFALLVVALVVTLWTRTSYAVPTGVTSVFIGGAGDAFGCNNCHGTGSPPSLVTLTVSGGGSTGLLPIPTPLPLPNVTVAPGVVSTLSATFRNSNSAPTFARGGGFVVFHTDGSSNSSGTLGASSGSQACPGPAACPVEGVTNSNTEATHTAMYPANGSNDVTVNFTYLPPAGATTCGKYGFRIWLNAVDGNGDCGTVTDQAQAFDFTITVAGAASDGNDCHHPGVCSVSAIGSTGTWSFANWDNLHACNDSKSCTTSDHCNGGGTCIGTVNCPPMDVCHLTGACDAGGACTAPPAPAATVCSDGKSCTTSDHCDGAGSCTGTVSCPPIDVCHLTGACNAGGACTAPFAPATQV